MITAKKSTAPILLALALAFSSAACSSDLGNSSSGAFLTIQGSANPTIGYGDAIDLTIKYQDSNQMPLAGEIDFTINGDRKGSSINVSTMAVNSNGEVRFKLTTGSSDTIFEIQASAALASPVTWNVTVTEGNVPENMDIRGTYTVDSDFDLAAGLPGTLGDTVNLLIDLTDDPDDPAKFILEELDIDPGATITKLVNDKLLEETPTFIDDLLKLGKAFGDVGRNFGIISEIKIAGDTIEAANLKATHTLKLFSFEIEGVTQTFTMNELNSPEEFVNDITVELDTSTGVVDLAEHSMPIPYGGFLALAMEQFVVPLVDSSIPGGEGSLTALIQKTVQCDTLGPFIHANTPDLGLGITVQQVIDLCGTAVESISSEFLQQLRDIDTSTKLTLNIAGKTSMKDLDNDDKADRMSAGRWSGTMSADGSTNDLAGDNTFTGSRKP